MVERFNRIHLFVTAFIDVTSVTETCQSVLCGAWHKSLLCKKSRGKRSRLFSALFCFYIHAAPRPKHLLIQYLHAIYEMYAPNETICSEYCSLHLCIRPHSLAERVGEMPITACITLKRSFYDLQISVVAAHTGVARRGEGGKGSGLNPSPRYFTTLHV